MKIKITVKEKAEEIEFPVIRQSRGSGCVLLMINETTGISLQPPDETGKWSPAPVGKLVNVLGQPNHENDTYGFGFFSVGEFNKKFPIVHGEINLKF